MLVGMITYQQASGSLLLRFSEIDSHLSTNDHVLIVAS